MLFGLIVKYFFHNKRRTYRAIAILTVGIALVMSTDMLMTGFISQVQQFASAIDVQSSQIDIQTTGNHVFTNSEITNIRQIIAEYDGITSYEYLMTFGQTFDQSWSYVDVIFANISELEALGWIDVPDNVSQYPLISSKGILFDYFNDNNFSMEVLGNKISTTGIQTYIPLKKLSAEVIFDRNANYTSSELQTSRNRVFITIRNEQTFNKIYRRLSQIDGISIQTENPSNQFLEISGRQVTRILLLLQFAMSFLLILSISYVMISLVQDSEDDIRIMKMVGLSKYSLFMVFMGQSLLVSIFASVTAFFLSLGLLYSLLPFMAILNLPYGVVVVNPLFIGLTVLQAIIIGILSGLYPSYIGAK